MTQATTAPTTHQKLLAWVEQIAELAERHDLAVVSDEIYTRLTYDGADAPSIGAHPALRERSIVVDGFSKTYAMTGWRLGYGIFPPELIPHIDRLAVNSVSCTNASTQMAGVAALTGPQDDVEAMVAEFEKRRDLIVDGLNAMPGVTCQKPLGAFYVFPNVAGTGIAADDLARRLLDEAGVAVLAGSAFGEVGRANLRISYANSRENLARALERMGEFVEAL